ncbi:DUF1775 domain-containing protein [Pseudosporangium ferrugineum]|uniref:DUF1775 domain-containing protein n=1 Tax=Pseudosporangium ferrugineum TaxID=439699 RepID=UPI001304F365|nr:DUF1775 domain-containing protein [Pseudosporangium ferrugineum]
MTRLEKHRRAGVLAATTAAGVLGLAAPAAADATVSPAAVPQGSGQNVAFTVTNTGQSPITRVRLVLPADQPVAEVYPLSVPDWAPQIEHRKLDKPLDSIHGGGTQVTETAASITWIAMPGKTLPPGRSADLTVALGPLPTTGSHMSFTVQPTYADPAKGAPMPPVVLNLTPAAPGQAAAGHGGHGGTAAGDTTGSDADAATFAAMADAADDGPGFWTIAGWVVAALAAAGGAVAVLRSRRRTETSPAAPAGESAAPTGETAAPAGGTAAPAGEAAAERELVPAGKPRVTAWRYKDGPEE